VSYYELGAERYAVPLGRCAQDLFDSIADRIIAQRGHEFEAQVGATLQELCPGF
jgi:hypothetical protein